MPRSPLQSDFVIQEPEPEAPELDPDGPPIGEATAVVEMPRRIPFAVWRTNQASSRATKIVMTATWIALAILLLMCLIGPHIPAGE